MTVADTRAAILDAAVAEASAQGLRGLTVEDVAERADVSRQTVYRHFRNRENLVGSAILREEQRLIDGMTEVADEGQHLHDTIRLAVVHALDAADGHPLLRRLLAEEPDELLPYLLLGRGPVISAAEPVVRELLVQHRPTAPDFRVTMAADMVTRLLVAYVVSPPPHPRVDLAREIAHMVVRYMDG